MLNFNKIIRAARKEEARLVEAQGHRSCDEFEIKRGVEKAIRQGLYDLARRGIIPVEYEFENEGGYPVAFIGGLEWAFGSTPDLQNWLDEIGVKYAEVVETLTSDYKI